MTGAAPEHLLSPWRQQLAAASLCGRQSDAVGRTKPLGSRPSNESTGHLARQRATRTETWLLLGCIDRVAIAAIKPASRTPISSDAVLVARGRDRR